jgi:membrane fusion protein (multidrug efflux system)
MLTPKVSFQSARQTESVPCKTLPFSLLLATLLLLSACNPAGQEAPQQAPETQARSERPAHPVEIEIVSRQAISISRTLTGTLEAPRTVHIHSEQTGRIVELAYFEGDKVKKDAVLASLDDALLRAELAKVVASRKQAEVDLKRLQRLASSNLSSEDLLAKASTAVELAQAEESLQRTLLSRTVIRAPFAAVISERLKEPGDVVAVNEHILTLFDPDYMTAAVQVPEQLHSRVADGDSVEVRIDSLGDRSFNAKILRIHPKVDPQTRQGMIEIRLDPVPHNARPGQLCRVTLHTAETPRRLISLNALQFDGRGSFVYRLGDDSRAMRVGVTIGLQIGDTIEIIDGVDDGDKIVSKGFLGLKSGKTVRIVDPAAQVSSGPGSVDLSRG